jgi:2-keto-4-pentenoate hydratase/2-oxohepta-3-ene-1,7-dioic acid hydratase in catechol pathway
LRIVRFSEGDASPVTCGLVGDSVVPLHKIGLPDDPIVALEQGPSTWREAAIRLARIPVEERIPLSAGRLEAPIRRPPKFLAVAFNTPTHAAELEAVSDRPEFAAILDSARHTRLAHPDPRFPTFFNKQSTCVTGPFDPIWLPRDSDQLDYEGEMAVVIGHRARRLSVDGAAAAIAGYTVCNDVSVRDWQAETPTIWPGKSFDTHGPIGPWIVTADEVEPGERQVRTWVNGELRQDGSTADLLRSPAELVSYLSNLCTLEPGDVIATGTPAGIGLLQGRMLSAGDSVRIEVEGVGAIENEVVPEPASDGLSGVDHAEREGASTAERSSL